MRLYIPINSSLLRHVLRFFEFQSFIARQSLQNSLREKLVKLNSSSSKKDPTKKETRKDHKLDFISLQNQSVISEIKFKKYGKPRQSKMI